MSEQSPLERAARAAAKQHGFEWDNIAPTSPVELDQAHFFEQARAVLTAVREPIDEAIVYLNADADAWETGSDDAPHRAYLVHCAKLRRDISARLQAVIDAALNEKP